ncbi:MAG: radical SAM protein [Spirochaetes bacterium]|nr:radical SAM protein [Spirochaetota bacterium]
MKDMKNELRLIFWELTKRCNLKCIHCRAEATEALCEELSTNDIFQTIDEIARFAKPIIVLTGGEPLYRADVFDIAHYAVQKKFRVALATNGTLIDALVAKKIRDSGISRVSISIDGSTAATHDAFRGIQGSFDEAMRGARELTQVGVEFQFNITITRRNVHEFEDVISFAQSNGAKAVHAFMLVPVGCGAQIASSDMLSSEEYERVLHRLYEISRDFGFEVKATCAPHYYRIIRQRARNEGRKISFETDGLSAITRGCLAGLGVCFISHKGDVQPCGYLPLAVGNIRHTPLGEIWESSRLFLTLRDFSLLSGKCGACEYIAFCGGCRARAYFATNNPFDEEPYCLYVPARLRASKNCESE